MVTLLKQLYRWPWGPFWVTAGGAAVEVPLFLAAGYVRVAVLSLVWFTVALASAAWTATSRTRKGG